MPYKKTIRQPADQKESASVDEIIGSPKESPASVPSAPAPVLPPEPMQISQMPRVREQQGPTQEVSGILDIQP